MSYDIVTNEFRKMIYSKFPVRLTQEEENRIDDLCEELYLVCIDSHTSKAKKENALLHLIAIIMPYFVGLIEKYNVGSVVSQEDLDMVIATTVYKIISNKSFNNQHGSSFLYYLSCSLQRELKKEYKVGLPLYCGSLTPRTKAEILKFEKADTKKYYSLSEFDEEYKAMALNLKAINGLVSNDLPANDLDSRYWVEPIMKESLIQNLLALGQEGKALYLYFGLDRGEKRSMREVGDIMNMSRKQILRLINKGKIKFKNSYPSFYDDYAA